MFAGAVPPWLTGLVICSVVLFYIFSGGLRAAAWANAFQTIVFMITGVVAFFLIADKLGGLAAAGEQAVANVPELVARQKIGHLQFLTYAFVPLSVAMFPHLFQHWLTAKSAKTFRLTAIAHPVFIMIVWVPCILIGVWAAGIGMEAPGGNQNAILAKMVGTLLKNPYLTGALIQREFGAGVPRGRTDAIHLHGCIGIFRGGCNCRCGSQRANGRSVVHERRLKNLIECAHRDAEIGQPNVGQASNGYRVDPACHAVFGGDRYLDRVLTDIQIDQHRAGTRNENPIDRSRRTRIFEYRRDIRAGHVKVDSSNIDCSGWKKRLIEHTDGQS